MIKVNLSFIFLRTIKLHKTVDWIKQIILSGKRINILKKVYTLYLKLLKHLAEWFCFLTRTFIFYLDSKWYIYLKIKWWRWEVNIWPLGFVPINIKILYLQIILRLNFNFATELKFHSLSIFEVNYRLKNDKKKEINGLDRIFWVLATWMYSFIVQTFPVNPNTFKNISC